jgi:arsenite-transporting ATPase
LAGLEKQRAQYKAAVEALANPDRTRLILVARAQSSTLREAAATYGELSSIGMSRQYVVINGILPETEARQDSLAQAVYRREQEALRTLPEVLKQLPCDFVELKPFNVVGLDALRQFFTDAAAGGTPLQQGEPSIETPNLYQLIDDIAASEHGLVMVMGKASARLPASCPSSSAMSTSTKRNCNAACAR